jgi:hypothetical protein
MGRQKTLWIDEGCWEILEEMGDGSMSSKVRRCILDFKGVHEEEAKVLERVNEQQVLLIEALKKQIKSYKSVVRDGEEPEWWMLEGGKNQ